jgi:hypothetical protein
LRRRSSLPDDAGPGGGDEDSLTADARQPGPEGVTAMVEPSADAAGQGVSAPGSGRREVFEVRVTGSVEEDVLRQLSDVEVRSQELRTSLRGVFVDQAELHGFLARLRAFGLDVVEVHRLPDSVAESATVSTEAEREP